jgi:methenyltetrahydrofolate cyclohydrolase
VAPFGERTVAGFLADVAARRSAPGGGAVAAVTVASAAGLAAMSARYSSAADAPALAAAADAERTAALAMADADAAAYGEVLAAMRGGDRDRIRAALDEAAAVPLRIAQAGARVVGIAVAVAAGGNPHLTGDVRAAVLLAEAGARAAAELVRINVELGDLDPAVAAAAANAVNDAGAGSRQVGDGA